MVLPASALGQRAEVAEVFQLDGEIDVADNDIAWHVQDDGGEIEDRVHSRGHETVRHVLRCGRWHGDDAHADLAAANKILQFVKGQNRLTVGLASFAFHIDIKTGNNLEALFFKSLVGQQCQTEMADTDEYDGLKLGAAQHLGNLVA